MNPELRRNLWLELSVHRVIAMPVVLLLVMGLIGARSSDPWGPAYTVGLWSFVLLVHLWGARNASDAVTEEVRARTWDWQRLSTLGPWQMTWGKLVGATALGWYGAAWCIAAMAFAQLSFASKPGFAWIALGLVASGIGVQGAALAGSVQAARKDMRAGVRLGVLVLVAAALVSAFGIRGPWSIAREAEWFGGSYGSGPFLALSALAFAAWAVLAAWREMARELKERALPWAYPAFGVFLGAYLAGFVAADTPGYVRMVVLLTFLVAVALVYFGLFVDVTTAMTLRRLALHARAGDWRRVLESLPYWATALALAAAFAIATAALPAPPADLVSPRVREWPGAYPAFVLVLGAARDAGLLVFFALARRPRRVEAMTLLYIVLLWWIVPGLADIAVLPGLSQAFRPIGLAGWQGTLVMAVHVAAVWGAVAWRWRRRGEALDARPGDGLPRGV